MKDLETQALCDLWLAHERGDLDRQKFWELMRDHHLRLHAYPPLLAKGEVESIQIGETGLIAWLESGLRFFLESRESSRACFRGDQSRGL